MVLYKVYSQEHRVRYFAHSCSTAVLFQIVALLLTFMPPLFTSYFTSGFYYKRLTYNEQPNIEFLRRYNVIIDTTTNPIFSSSDPQLNTFFVTNYYASSLNTSLPRDVNGDGIFDQQTIIINQIVPTSLTTEKTLNLWLLFQYALNQYPLVNMETLGLISLSAPLSISNYGAVTIYGQLRFQQREPILSYTNVSALQGPVIDYTNMQATPSLNDIYNNYTSRNYLTSFDAQYVHWSSSSSSSSTQLNITVVVNYGSQSIVYVPNFWKEFRWTWIQYVTSLLPFFYLANKVKEFAFSNQLVRTMVK